LILVIQGMSINIDPVKLNAKGCVGRGGSQKALKAVFDSSHSATVTEKLKLTEKCDPQLSQIDDTALIDNIADIPDVDLPIETEVDICSQLLEHVQNETLSPEPITETLTHITESAADRDTIAESVMQATATIDMPQMQRKGKAATLSYTGSETFFEEQKGPLASEIGNGDGKIAGTGDFFAEISYAKDPAGGYLFRIAFLPRQDRSFKHISQNLFFLLDRSHSIANKRFHASKKAILHALELLRPSDTFNILVFDSKVRRMAPDAVPFCAQSLERAKDFLKSQRPGGLMTGTDIYASLDIIVPKAVADTEVNTAILLSDGDTKLKKSEQRRTVGQWSKQNGGKVSLFSMASGGGNNLPLLDLLSQNNKGFLAYCRNRRDIDATIYQMVNEIKNPIGKDLVVTAVPTQGACDLTLYPRQHRLADLYQDKPYVLYGRTNQLCDVFLFLQGKFYDRWFDIKEMISFDNAEPVEIASLQQSFDLHIAYDSYDHFIADGQELHLQEAGHILAPYKIPPAFR